MVFTDHPQPDFSMPKTTDGIRALREINGLSIAEIEQILKSHNSRYSSTGFLGQDESLINVLALDNETVLRLELTHKHIAESIESLFSILNYPPMYHETQGMDREQYSTFMEGKKKGWANGKVTFLNGKHFLVVLNSYNHDSVLASIKSPMGDDYVSGSEDINVVDVDELHEKYGLEIQSWKDFNYAYINSKIPDSYTCRRNFPRMLIHLIGSYGFYEGLQS